LEIYESLEKKKRGMEKESIKGKRNMEGRLIIVGSEELYGVGAST